MTQLTRLSIIYLLQHTSHLFISNNVKNSSAIIIAVPTNYFYFLSLHLKFATTWYSTQLMDFFSYDVPVRFNMPTGVPKTTDTIIVANFHNLVTQNRIFIFTKGGVGVKSIANLFANACWLEREAAEMSGLFFVHKGDLRNLLLTYGDVTSPLKKHFPSTGFKEIFYDINNDTLIQAPISLQI